MRFSDSLLFLLLSACSPQKVTDPAALDYFQYLSLSLEEEADYFQNHFSAALELDSFALVPLADHMNRYEAFFSTPDFNYRDYLHIDSGFWPKDPSKKVLQISTSNEAVFQKYLAQIESLGQWETYDSKTPDSYFDGTTIARLGGEEYFLKTKTYDEDHSHFGAASKKKYSIELLPLVMMVDLWGE
ncbi:MAG: hypothetical protein AAF433_09230 [Bacteroidota bacterium]